MSYSAWKTLERRHAKRMGGERLWRPDYGDSAPDGQTHADVWDTKAYARFSVISLFVECEAKYREWAAGRRFHLCLFSRERPRAGDFVLLRADDYARLVRDSVTLERLRSLPEKDEFGNPLHASHTALRAMLSDSEAFA